MEETNLNFELRRIRNRLLRESDWTQLMDSPLAEEKKQAWAVYRQLLRDLPAKYNPSVDENNQMCGVEWPTIPE
jgi:hypothetical protein